MASESLLAIAQSKLFKLKRGMLQIAVEFYILVILACILVCLARCGPYKTDGLPELVDDSACDPYQDNNDIGFEDIYSSGLSLNFASADIVCSNPELFCFPSTLCGFKSEEHNQKAAGTGFASLTDVHNEMDSNSSWLSDHGIFELLNGRIVSCSLCYGEARHDLSMEIMNHDDECCLTSCTDHLLRRKDANSPADISLEIEGIQFMDASSPQLVISPSQLDWGENYLYHPSLAFITLKNTCNESELNVYKSFSTDAQFYPWNFTEFALGPGEVASLCFVFLPISLGFSSAEIVVQTSLGGFLLKVKGYSTDTPYQVSPLVEFDVFPNGWRGRNLSLSNPFEESIQVEEVAVWTSVFVRNASLLAEAICREKAETGMYGSRRDAELGSPVMAVRPLSNWLIGPGKTETVVGISFFHGLEAKVSGAICMRLHRPLQNSTDVLIVPVDAQINSKLCYRNIGDSVYASVEAVGVYDSGDAAVTISLSNNASYLLRIIEISEVSEKEDFLQIKYFEGLLLFPGTMAQVALVTYRPISAEYDPLLTSTNCKLKILTNDSSNPLIMIPCWDFVHIFPRHVWESSVRYEEQPGIMETGSQRGGSKSSGKECTDTYTALKKAEADESVLQDWRSHNISSDLSLLDYHEVDFAKIPVGRHISELITVRNPSQQPVVMQLILNSGEIVHDCRSADGYLQPPSSNSFLLSDSTRPPIYGFSLAVGALTEAYVHPFGKASLGPILFHPSSRCSWKSSALIRNNLSGVEWLTLRGSGGLLSLVLLEGSKPVQKLDFNLDVSLPLNVASPSVSMNKGGAFYGCHKPLSKALLLINSGDLPVTVGQISTSGTKCGLDGFVVQNCTRFIVEPGEAKELVISYQTDLSAAMVQRDLELSLDTGVLVIPMKATIPMHALQICQQAMFWFWLKRCSSGIFAAFLVIFLILCSLSPCRVVSSLGYLIRGENPTVITRDAGKSSKLHNQPEGGDFSMTTKVNKLLRSAGEDEESLMRSIAHHPAGKSRVSNLYAGAENVETFRDSESKTITTKSKTRKEIVVPFHQPSKTHTIETSEAELPQPCTDKLGPPEPVKLTVRTGTDKARRRRKRRGGLIGLAEVSSSQSGNSTPSSPLSPTTALTPKSVSTQPADREEPIKLWTPFSFASVISWKDQDPDGDSSDATLQRPSALGKMNRRPVLLPSVTFPGMGRSVPGMLCPSPSQSSESMISPHARAPGSKLLNQISGHAEEVPEDKFTYNIWDTHFSGLHLNSRSDDVSATSSVAAESNSNSFFLRAPQTVVTNSPHRSVSYIHQGS
ncbi:hypothetical protein Dimus_017123 [Dionaea muscipula]